MHSIQDRSASEPTRLARRARRVAAGIAWAMLLCAPGVFAQSSVPVSPDVPTSGATPLPAASHPEAATDPAGSSAVAEARAAFQGGIALAKAEHWARALEAFERSEALHPHAITMYNIGYCELSLGHWTLARKKLAQALENNRARGQVELPIELVSAAERYLKDANGRIARVVVTITSGAVSVDGRPLELAATGGPRPVLVAGTREAGSPEVPPSVIFEVLADPGTHVFVLSVKGRADVSASETLAPGTTSTLSLAVPELTTDSPALAPAPQKSPNRVPAFVAFGVGAAGIAVGTVSGLVALGKKDDVHRACQGADSSLCNDELESGNRAADIATAGFIVGGVASAVGVLLLVFASQGTAADKVSRPASIEPGIRPMLAWPAIGLEGRF